MSMKFETSVGTLAAIRLQDRMDTGVYGGKNRASVDQSQGKTKFDAGNGFIDMFVQVSLDNSIVVDTEPLAEGVLGDFETPIHVAPQPGSKKKPNRQDQLTLLQ